jgi:hypothetical protein
MGLLDRFKPKNLAEKNLAKGVEGSLLALRIPEAEPYNLGQFRQTGTRDLINMANDIASYPRQLRRAVWHVLKERRKEDSQAAAFVDRSWEEAVRQVVGLHLSEKDWNWAQGLGAHPDDAVQFVFLMSILNRAQHITIANQQLIPELTGVGQVAFVARNQGRLFRFTGLDSLRRQVHEHDRIHTGLPLFCTRCGAPMTRLVPVVGLRNLGQSFGRTYLTGANGPVDEQVQKAFFHLMNIERELLALPACDSCDVSKDIYFGFEFIHINAYLQPEGYLKNYFYTSDKEVAANLYSLGFSVAEVTIKDGHEVRPAYPVKMQAPVGRGEEEAVAKAKEGLEQALEAGGAHSGADRARQWRILDYDLANQRALLIANDVIAEEWPYLEKRTDFNRLSVWKNSSIRRRLNSSYLDMLPSYLKSRVVEVTNQNPDNPQHRMGWGGEPTEDKVFLLSFKEARRYFANDADRVSHCQGQACPWLLRSTGEDKDRAMEVNSQGSIDMKGCRKGGVAQKIRPSFWLDLSGVDFDELAREVAQAEIDARAAAEADIREKWAQLSYVCSECGHDNQLTGHEENPCVCRHCGVENHDLVRRRIEHGHGDEAWDSYQDECRRCGLITNIDNSFDPYRQG